MAVEPSLVDVVIAVHRDPPLPAATCLDHRRDRLPRCHRAAGVRVFLIGRQERPRASRLLESASNEHLGERIADPQLGAQPRHRALLTLRDLETGLSHRPNLRPPLDGTRPDPVFPPPARANRSPLPVKALRASSRLGREPATRPEAPRPARDVRAWRPRSKAAAITPEQRTGNRRRPRPRCRSPSGPGTCSAPTFAP